MSAPTPAPRRIASFDIGIKNMAVCVVEKGAAADWKILFWGILNVGDATPAAAVCSQCRARAVFSAGTTLYCKRHVNKDRILTAAQIERAVKYTAATWATFCKKHGLVARAADRRATLEEFFMVRLPAAARASEVDLISVGRNMIPLLDALPRPDEVRIENQIGPIATRMKTVQGMVTQYYLMRHSDAEIRYISSSQKLKVKMGTDGATAAPATARAPAYKDRKKKSIEMCRAAIAAAAPEWLATLETSPKKDDLADCFLQAFV